MALAQNYKESRILKTMEDNMENVEPALKEAFAKYLEVHGDRDAEREIAPTIKELAAKSDIAMVKELADVDLVSKSIWIVGGDGWAVSYTHLDVYKRHLSASSSTGGMKWTAVSSMWQVPAIPFRLSIHRRHPAGAVYSWIKICAAIRIWCVRMRILFPPFISHDRGTMRSLH